MVQERLDNFLTGITHNVLTDEEKELCDTDISLQEMGEALKQLNNNSAPGPDGLTAEFYKFFWRALSKPLLESFKKSIQLSELSLSQRRGIITLIHKGNNTPREDLNNWRPMTLTNVGYKILTKLLAIRLQKEIKNIINENQTGFIKGRNISSHIRLIDDIIKYASEENIEGMIVSLDYQKAFDSVNKDTILAALRRFNFGPRFITYINTILANTQSSVKNGGWHSQWFPTERGVRQGCCVSPLLFVLVVELLAIKLRHNDTINGILRNSNVSDNIKLLQYADDMSLLLKGKVDLKIALKEIELFTKVSGLKLNRKKSIGMWVGSKADSNEGGEGIKWTNGEENIRSLL
ncbi:retrovirus-related Pol polyprotein from type-1 retrotransposable element R2 [Elysia marginata]|uniref:Retrovirus-related Pol polyprotein from type-1 retrotransposable element R2 n=1 Tax=Elysia marginata TaxID=1093978 RepID=A0AAV4FMH0_9GAST|nr:retrovirus-related Pol polyprotein from type-1 retrotransposable element R2 [Elysia marginata]